MTVLHDDGLYRHLRFTNPERSWCYWFDLITVPGALIFQGDGDAFVFHRLEDMFGFFRGSAWQGAPNVSYWAEKLTGGERSVRVYQQEMLQQLVDDAVAQAAKDNPKLANLPAEVREYLTDEMVGERTYDLNLVDNFRFWIDPSDRYSIGHKEPDFTFGSALEWDCEDYHWWFLWACHAILWGIGQYDASKAASVSAAAKGAE
jgi:hypothetical protein